MCPAKEKSYEAQFLFRTPPFTHRGKGRGWGWKSQNRGKENTLKAGAVAGMMLT
ncbi:MAG: hypothetical protein K9J30_06460 [Bacteroidales bacterium]|nr:hypothetical protein [Bacteroidales bacterium]